MLVILMESCSGGFWLLWQQVDLADIMPSLLLGTFCGIGLM